MQRRTLIAIGTLVVSRAVDQRSGGRDEDIALAGANAITEAVHHGHRPRSRLSGKADSPRAPAARPDRPRSAQVLRPKSLTSS